MTDAGSSDRIERERAFHDERFSASGEEERGRFYDYVDGARSRLRQAGEEFSAGERVLELGAGLSSTGWDLARRGVHVTAIDISPVAVEQARAAAEAEGLESIEFCVMNAEQLDFAAGSFDGVIGSGILHHLDIDRSLTEIKRVLSPSGRVVFYEPLGHNPLINWYRNRTPGMRSDDEHPIVRNDFAIASRHFEAVDATMHHCTVIACALLPRAIARVLRPVFDGVDRVIGRVPGLRWQSWITVMELNGPIR